MRSREIAPLKPPDVDIDLHRFTTTNHHYETPINRKFSSHFNLFFLSRLSVFFCFLIKLIFSYTFFFFGPDFIHFFSFFVYFPYSTPGQHQHQPLYLNKRMVLPAKRQTPAGSVVKKKL